MRYDSGMKGPRSLFDVLGPVMIGPSSSHTAGAVRLGALARSVFGGTPERVSIGLHGSFARTGHGHGTDIALVAGLLGMRADDPAIRGAFEAAGHAGMEVEFCEVDLGDAHPNTASFDMAAEGRSLRVTGSSVGGAEVELRSIGAFAVEASGRLPFLTVVHADRPGEVAAVTSVLAKAGVNIAAMRVSRAGRGGEALMLIETDTVVPAEAVASLACIDGVAEVRSVPAV